MNNVSKNSWNVQDTLKEENVYSEFTLNNMKDISYLETLNGLGWVWRGHADSNWLLRTSFERGVSSRNSSFSSENTIIDKFKKSALKMLKTQPNDIVEWLSLMQHYGAPTRFLDFTKSPYIATFFALSDETIFLKNDESLAAIWGINLSSLEIFHSLRHKIPNCQCKVSYEEKLNLIEQSLHSSNSLKRKLLVDVEPRYDNERLGKQQGLFIVPLDIYHSFHDNLLSTFCLSQKVLDKNKLPSIDLVEGNENKMEKIFNIGSVVKINIPIKIRLGLLSKLEQMNIDHYNLFPDLGGLAKSLYSILDKSRISH